jgi:hypothetical protein
MNEQRPEAPEEKGEDEQSRKPPSDFNDPVDEAADESFPASVLHRDDGHARTGRSRPLTDAPAPPRP